KKGPPAQIIQAWRKHAYILITSKEIIREIKQVLQYPHITKKYHLQKEDIKSLIHLIEHEAVILPISPRLDVVKEDPEDNKILACALEAEADYIVSGNNHLLSMRQYKDIAIVTAREFLRAIDSET
ncbi:MAG: putative toxin-antitoxin system toxin component, PIN family, partial [Candidatus Omnitrophota bacterium]